MGSHNASFATKRGVQTPVKSNPMEAVELNDLVNLEVSDGTEEGAYPASKSQCCPDLSLAKFGS